MAETYSFTFRATASMPADLVQRRQPGHPLVGDSPIRDEFDTGEEYVEAWSRWRRMTLAYEREERLYGEEARVRLRTWAELRYPLDDSPPRRGRADLTDPQGVQDP